MALLTIIQIVIGVFGTVAIIVTIYQTRRATRQAANAIKLQEQTAQKQLRAYVTIIPRIPQSIHGGSAFVFNVKNTGVTPAKIKYIKFSGFFGASDKEMEPDWRPCGGGFVLEAGGDWPGRVALNYPDNFDFNIKGPGRTIEDVLQILRIDFKVEYDDIYNKDNYTKISVEYTCDGGVYSVHRHVPEGCTTEQFSETVRVDPKNHCGGKRSLGGLLRCAGQLIEVRKQ